MDGSQTRILRIAAFLVDALTIALVLVVPTSLISYALAWIGGSVKGIQIVWWVALAILVLSMHDESLFAQRALRAGARGYLQKHEAIEGLVGAIHHVLFQLPLKGSKIL